MKKLRWSRIVGEVTEEEMNTIVKEICERIKDIIYMNLEHRIRMTVQDVIEIDPLIDDYIDIEWKITLAVSDLIQIIGRVRRSKPKGLNTSDA